MDIDLKQKVLKLEKELIELKQQYELTKWTVLINSSTILILVLSKVFLNFFNK